MEKLVQPIRRLSPILQSERLVLDYFKPSGAAEAYASITPSLTRFMAWDAPESEQVFATVWQN